MMQMHHCERPGCEDLGHETDIVSWEYKNQDVLKVNKMENKKAKLQCE